MLSFLRLLKPVVVIVITALPAQAAPAHATTCFDDWSDAAPVMLKEKLRRHPRAARAGPPTSAR